jgi:hypothetical protein
MKDSCLYNKIKAFSQFAEMMPAVVIIQQVSPFTSIYMNSLGLSVLGITIDELKEMGPEYLERYFDFEDTEEVLEKLGQLLNENNMDKVLTFFQQVKLKDIENWVWHIGSTRIFYQDKAGKPTHILTTAIPIDKLQYICQKAEKIVDERDFIKLNEEKLKLLGKREIEVLKEVAIGKSSIEIAKELFLSIETVKSHRKSIKKKLEIKSPYEYTIYANNYNQI